MWSLPIRDQVNDRPLTPKNAALILIDYQPVQVNSVASMDRQMLVNNIVGVAKLGVAFGLPIVLSSVNVTTGINKPTIPQLRRVLGNVTTHDRTTINAWEDAEFVQAVRTANRKKLIMAALWTEPCLTFPALDALSEGYEVYPVVDAVGRHVARSSPGGAAPYRTGRSQADRLGAVGVRTATRLGTQGHRAGVHGRLHINGKHDGTRAFLRTGQRNARDVAAAIAGQ